MKKRVLLVLLLILALVLCACDKRAQTPGDIIPMLREELQLEENDGTVISCIGVYTADPTTSAWVFENSLLWFSFDHDNYTYYRAVGCQQTSSGKFIVRKIYEPMTYTEDIVHVVWGGNDVYCVNDPNCRTIYFQFTSGDISMPEISPGDHPCIFVYHGAGSLDFLDEHGKSVRDGRPILPSENDPVEPPAKDPESTEKDPEPEVSSNPDIDLLLETINKALAEAGHPLTIAVFNRETLHLNGELWCQYTGDGTDPYLRHVKVEIHHTNPVLNPESNLVFDCSAYDNPSPEARDAVRIIYQAALPLYDSVLNEKYAQAFVHIPDGIVVNENRQNIYGVTASMEYIEEWDFSRISVVHKVHGMHLYHWQDLEKDEHCVYYQIRRLNEPLVYQQETLTEEELAEINTWFAWDGGPEGYPAGNSFLTCIYTRPSELNLFEVFGGQGGTDNQNGQISDAERNALANVQEHYASGYEVQKFKRSSMDKLLKQYTGCKLKDHQWRDMDTFFVYLDNYDAYYTVYGGTNKSSYTMVDGCKNPDGTLSLVYKNDRTVYETGYEYCVVTLKPAESGSGFHGYWFVSNLPHIG